MLGSCPNCGENVQADAKFCGSCGKPFTTLSASVAPTSTPLPAEPEQFVPLSYEPLPTQSTPVEDVTPLAGRQAAQRGPRRISNERSNKLLILYGVLTAIILVVLVGYFTTRGANSGSAFTPDQPTPVITYPPSGIGTAVPDEGNAHVAAQSVITYNVYPPSSGTHYPDTAPNGFSEVEVPEGNFVHSMEHGAIVLYYRPDVSDDIKQQLKDLFNKLPPDQYGTVKLVVTPYTKGMTTPLAIAAWDRLLLMKEYNFDEIRVFYQTWVNKGPENVP